MAWDQKVVSTRSVATRLVLFIIAYLAAVSVTGLIYTDTCYTGHAVLRVAMLNCAFVFSVYGGVSILPGHLPTDRKTLFVGSAHIIGLHYFAISLCIMIVSVVGLAVAPTLRNAAYPHIIVSLDVFCLPALLTYMLYVLYELAKTQRLSLAAVAQGVVLSAPSALDLARSGIPGTKPKPFRVPTRPRHLLGLHTPYILATCTVAAYTALGVGRLLTDRTAAAILYVVWFVSLIPVHLQAGFLLRQLYVKTRLPAVRASSMLFCVRVLAALSSYISHVHSTTIFSGLSYELLSCVGAC